MLIFHLARVIGVKLTLHLARDTGVKKTKSDKERLKANVTRYKYNQKMKLSLIQTSL